MLHIEFNKHITMHLWHCKQLLHIGQCICLRVHASASKNVELETHTGSILSKSQHKLCMRDAYFGLLEIYIAASLTDLQVYLDLV